MARNNDELLKRLLETFRMEADEHLQALSSGLVVLEKMPAPAVAAEQVETLFREVHSLKGAARAVNRTSVESFCRELENVFASLKDGRLKIAAPLLDLLHQAVDALQGLLAGEAEDAPASRMALARLMQMLEAAATGLDAPQPAPASAATGADESGAHVPVATTAASAGTVRVSTEKLDMALRQAEELLSPRLAARQRVTELREAAAAVTLWKKRRVRIQPSLRQIERAAERGGTIDAARHSKELHGLLEYLDDEQQFIAATEERLRRLGRDAARDERTLAGMADGLQNVVKEMQLLPFASLLDLLPRLVRELAREQGKNVELALGGSEIEIDRRILDELKDPLIHLLRNAVDHGIEAPAARAAAGKPPQGTLTLAIAQGDGGWVEIRVADDGAGIDTGRVKAVARKLGAISTEAAEVIGEREAQALVLRSGISTSPIVTDVSGRGLGLAIVREKVERLGGSVAIESQRGGGTAFRLVVPLTVATFRAVLVRVGERLCAIPASGVERVARIAADDVRTVENRETMTLDGEVVALAALHHLLELPRTAGGDAAARAPVVIAGEGDARIALRVDEILGEQEILVKPLGPQLARVRNVAGASMLGNGQVVPVLNVADLLKSATRRAAPEPVAADTGQAAPGAQRSILVAEDSITSRALLKGILESAGYTVTTAVDGADAFAALKSAEFDLLVSDVEMPRMDGFDLTAKVRADRKLADLPVVLVTALGSREHRERGIDVGANAYIVKSSFDQSNLLEIVRRLL